MNSDEFSVNTAEDGVDKNLIALLDGLDEIPWHCFEPIAAYSEKLPYDLPPDDVHNEKNNSSKCQNSCCGELKLNRVESSVKKAKVNRSVMFSSDNRMYVTLINENAVKNLSEKDKFADSIRDIINGM